VECGSAGLGHLPVEGNNRLRPGPSALGSKVQPTWVANLSGVQCGGSQHRRRHTIALFPRDSPVAHESGGDMPQGSSRGEAREGGKSQ
jgi:hypothetical protein